MRSISLLTVICTVFMMASGCVKSTTVRHSADYASALAKKKTIAVLPPRALAYTEDTFYHEERQYDYEYYVEDRLHEILRETLNAKGYSVISPSVSSLREKKLFNIKDTLDTQVKKKKAFLYRTGTTQNIDTAHRIDADIAKYNAALAEGLNADALIFTDIKENVQTSGAKARDMALAALASTLSGNRTMVQPASDTSNVYIAVINGEDGKVLWMNILVGEVGGVNRFGRSETEKTDAKLYRIATALLDKLPDNSRLHEAQDALDVASETLAAASEK